MTTEPDGHQLDLSKPEDLALFCGLVPTWPLMAAGLDLTDPEHEAIFARRVQRAWDSVMTGLDPDADA
jgi:hypothetical protein